MMITLHKLAAIAIFSICPGLANAQAPVPTASSQSLPVQRTITSADGRKLDVIITNKTATAIKVKTTAGKEFTLEIAKLSTDDQTFVAGCKAPAAIGKKILYATNFPNVGDVANIEALRNTGYEVTLAYVPRNGDKNPNVPNDHNDIYDQGGHQKLTTVFTNLYAANLADYDILWSADPSGWDQYGLTLMRSANKLDLAVIVNSRRRLTRNFLAEGENVKVKDEGEPTYILVEKNFITYNDRTKIPATPCDLAILAQVRAEIKDVVQAHHRR